MKQRRFQTFSARLNLWILALGSLVFLSVLSVNYYLSRQLLEEYVRDLAISTINTAVSNIEAVLLSVSDSADTLALQVKANGFQEQNTLNSIQTSILANPDVYGMTVALEPGIIDGAVAGFAPYYYRKDDELEYADLSDKGYDYRQWDWYTRPFSNGKASWSEPYTDDGGGNTQMTTYSTPIIEQGKVIGVATADLELSWLHSLVEAINIGDAAYGFIVSADDVVIAHPNAAFNMMKLIDTLDNRIIPENWQRYLDSKRSDQAVYLKTPCRHIEGDCRVAIESLGETGWKILIILPEAELVADIRSLTLMNAMVAVLGLALLLVVITQVTHRLTRPLSSLALATRDIGKGNLDATLPELSSQDEISTLSRDFNSMRLSLRDHIEQVRHATASKQKLESEIQIARDIQMSMIPGAGNVSFAEQKHDLYACLRPAKSVGGDLYYFSLEQDRLRFMVGDVSDKGVPAAIFMAKAVTLYTRALRDGLTPGETFTMMNDILSDNNDACMFVTALCGELDLDTGHLVMANAGHMPPISLLDGHASELHADGATALGLMSDISYDDIHIDLSHGTALFMYTDGISEARNTDDVEYGEGRLLKMIEAGTNQGIELTGEAIITDVDAFAAGREQFDDITLFAIRYH